jgi:hypothetical protein
VFAITEEIRKQATEGKYSVGEACEADAAAIAFMKLDRLNPALATEYRRQLYTLIEGIADDDLRKTLSPFRCRLILAAEMES